MPFHTYILSKYIIIPTNVRRIPMYKKLCCSMLYNVLSLIKKIRYCAHEKLVKVIVSEELVFVLLQCLTTECTCNLNQLKNIHRKRKIGTRMTQHMHECTYICTLTSHMHTFTHKHVRHVHAHTKTHSKWIHN